MHVIAASDSTNINPIAMFLPFKTNVETTLLLQFIHLSSVFQRECRVGKMILNAIPIECFTFIVEMESVFWFTFITLFVCLVVFLYFSNYF